MRLTMRCRAPLAQRTFTAQKEEGTKAAAGAAAAGAAGAAAAAAAATETAAADNAIVRFMKTSPSSTNVVIATIKTGAADLLA